MEIYSLVCFCTNIKLFGFRQILPILVIYPWSYLYPGIRNCLFIVFRLKFHFSGYLLHMFNLLLGYLLMLAVMSYDAYILIAVIFGKFFSAS